MPGFEEHSIAVELNDEDLKIKSERMTGVSDVSPLLGNKNLVSVS